MKKIAFFGIPGHSRYTYANTLNHCDAMPRSSGSNLETILELYKETGNKGNMIHGEAPTRLLQMNRNESCYFSSRSLILDLDWNAEKIASELNQKFDLVVYSTANLIRPNFNPGCVAKTLDALTIEFVVLGMGMQNPLPPSVNSLHPNLIELLDVCNKKSAVFGVRGLETKAWLEAVGFGNATALGCPSLYVYPQNILDMLPPDPLQVQTALTGGYISARIPRSISLIDIFKNFETHYVMQDEMDELKEKIILNNLNENLYNDASGELNKIAVESILKEIHYRDLPFKSYRWFQDPNAWRMFAAQQDIYIGDRLHGGVVALQAGIPSIFISEDQRVDEVADFFSIPKVSARLIKGKRVPDLVAGNRLAPHH